MLRRCATICAKIRCVEKSVCNDCNDCSYGTGCAIDIDCAELNENQGCYDCTTLVPPRVFGLKVQIADSLQSSIRVSSSVCGDLRDRC